MRIGFTVISLVVIGLLLTGCVTSPRYTATKGASGERRADIDVYEEGIASYYADEFHGRQTSSGEIFNMDDFTAAHRTLPFNTKVKVTNTLNGKSVIVRINDRGPFVDDRIIDLSLAAAKAIGMIGTGTTPVLLEVMNIAPPPKP